MAEMSEDESKIKVAVVLFNLGGPDCKNAIKPFLLNFFRDKNIIRLPFIFRHMLAWLIANKRALFAARRAYRKLGFKSPLLDNSMAQGDALEAFLNGEGGELYRSFVCMRYWHPMAPQVVRDIRQWGAERLILLPLYPQYSTTTTLSSLDRWKKAAHEAGIERLPTSLTCCYPENGGFVKASAKNIIKCYEQARRDGYEKIRILFSAHGLPERLIRDGDPYQYQCERSARRIVKVLKADLDTRSDARDLDWQLCYQSRLGPLKWIGPSIRDALEKAAEDGYAVIIYPHAFTQEHVETLVELDIEYKELAERIGLKGYYRAKTVGTHPDFIAGLAEMVQKAMERKTVAPERHECLCPAHYTRCCMREKSLSDKNYDE